MPVLAAEIPSVANGALAKDGKCVTWRLKKNVALARRQAVHRRRRDLHVGVRVRSGHRRRDRRLLSRGPRVDKVDSHTIKIAFARPQPFWADAFCGNRGMIIPKHVFEPFKGAKSREAPANLKPVGTGAYRIVDFRPGDVVRAELNPNYHVANWPFFDTLEMKGGGDAASAARAVLQTGEFDYAWNMQVEDDILLRMEQGGKGRINIWPTGGVEHIHVQLHAILDGGRRRALERQDYPPVPERPRRPAGAEAPRGPLGRPRADLRPARARPRPTSSTRRPASARRTCAGSSTSTRPTRSWTRRAGSAAPTASAPRTASASSCSTRPRPTRPRQKTQQIVKQAAAKAGIEIEIKSVVASVFFGSDPANPDNYPHFYADLQMLTEGPTQPDAQYFMNRFVSWEMSSARPTSGRGAT